MVATTVAMPRHRRWLRRCVLAAVTAVLLVVVANATLLARADGRVHRVADCPPRDVALVLGCAPTLRDGRENVHFRGRIDTAAALWHAGGVRHLIVSGDNSRAAYDEPTAMRAALIARGVPASAITCDFAGRRTLDSLARARLVFGVERLVVITQRYHAARALALADGWGIDAIACATPDLPLRLRLKTEVREVASRTWAVFDLLLDTQPRFPGPPEPLTLAAR